MHTYSAEEDDEHGCPHVILDEGVAKGVHLTSIFEDGVEEGPEDGEDKGHGD